MFFEQQYTHGQQCVEQHICHPDSASSQFYICDGAQHFLDGNYAVFGMVIDGMEVMRAIAEVVTDSRDKPIEDVVIIKISIIDRE